MSPPARPSPLGLAVLGMLYGGPLHPYRMQRLLKDWGKDQVINVGQRSSLYKTIDRLAESGLIAPRQTERTGQYPERTVYGITGDGRGVVLEWLTDMLAKHRNEYPSFPAALSFAMLLGPEGTRSALRQRLHTLETLVRELREAIADNSPELPRVTLLETEYQLAVTEAEQRWVEQIVTELASGSLTWSYEDFTGAADAYLTDEA
jgi:DNA-binding PadR family transcriptional regulator